MFIKDKIIPKTIGDFIIHKSTATKLEKLFNKDFIENLRNLSCSTEDRLSLRNFPLAKSVIRLVQNAHDLPREVLTPPMLLHTGLADSVHVKINI